MRYLLAFLTAGFLLAGCGRTTVPETAEAVSSAAIPAETIRTAEDNFLIAVASDLHFDPENKTEGIVNPLTKYNQEITQALLWDAARSKADVLLICGDLVNGGRKSQHEALREVLKPAKEAGIPVYVLPGNHDLEKTENEEFARIYEEFGYEDAVSRDRASLSYAVSDRGHCFLMLDTGEYGLSEGAGFSKETLEWAEKELREASEKEMKILAAGHYPLLAPHNILVQGSREMLRLFEQYKVPLYFCGHLHSRSVNSKDSLTELVVEETTSYPCSYALVSESEAGEYVYTPRKISVNDWAEVNVDYYDPDLLQFETYQYELFRNRSEGTVDVLSRNHDISPGKLELAKDFLRKLQESYWEGTLSRIVPELKEHPGYPVFAELAEGTNYGPWLPRVLEHAVPYTGGFRLKNGELTELQAR